MMQKKHVYVGQLNVSQSPKGKDKIAHGDSRKKRRQIKMPTTRRIWGSFKQPQRNFLKLLMVESINREDQSSGQKYIQR